MDDERCSFPAQTGAWPALRDFVEWRCTQLALPRGAALRLELAAEELFINCAIHGLQPRKDAQVQVAIRDAGAEVELILEDEAAPFNPFADLELPGSGADPGQRPVGGLGRILVVGLSCRRHYERLSTGNRTTVAVLKFAAPGSLRD